MFKSLKKEFSKKMVINDEWSSFQDNKVDSAQFVKEILLVMMGG